MFVFTCFYYITNASLLQGITIKSFTEIS